MSCLRTTNCNVVLTHELRWRAHARVQGDCAPSWIFIQGRARSDLLFTMSDNTHPARRTRPGAKRFASGRAAHCRMTRIRPATRINRKKAAARATWGSNVSIKARVDQGAATADLVEPDGIEPTTSCLQSRRSPN